MRATLAPIVACTRASALTPPAVNDPRAMKLARLPLEFDVPAGTTSAALWFQSSSDCGGNYWDSDFGQNYVFSVP